MDLILQPLKSELNWPLGIKRLLPVNARAMLASLSRIDDEIIAAGVEAHGGGGGGRGGGGRGGSRFRTDFSHLLGSTNPCPIAVHMVHQPANGHGEFEVGGLQLLFLLFMVTALYSDTDAALWCNILAAAAAAAAAAAVAAATHDMYFGGTLVVPGAAHRTRKQRTRVRSASVF